MIFFIDMHISFISLSISTLTHKFFHLVS